MPIQTEKYIGCTIEIEGETNLRINNKSIDCGIYHSTQLIK